MDLRRSVVRLVVDTNLVAYFLLGTPKYIAETRAFWRRGDELIAPTVWEAEIANVVWMAARTGVVSREEASAKLALAARLGVHSVNNRTLWHGALAKALGAGVAVYDTLFVELADREETYVVTFDAQVLRTFPELARRPRQLDALS